MQLNKIILLSIALASSAFGADIQFSGTMDYTIHTHQNTHAVQAPSGKPIKLLKFSLSKHAMQALQTKVKIQKSMSTKALITASKWPAEKQLGMNNVPVLDQGAFGACVAFAHTAAIDAALGKGDYLSQLCLLQLGNYFPEHAYGTSGWQGSLGRFMLSRLDSHGFISKETQRSLGCGGLTEYPQNNEPTPSTSISFEDYHQLSEGLRENGISWAPIVDSLKTIIQGTDTIKTLDDVKRAINNEQRVTTGVFIPALDLGVVGAVGKHHADNDTWVLSTIIERELYLSQDLFFAAHEMVITGYDDNAEAIDDLGKTHKGLFTLRNSWGVEVGDQGDFYMSYDYFLVLVLEAQQIIQEEPEND